MSNLILAWESESKKRETISQLGSPANQYEDRPIKKFYWNKRRDHPIPGLAHYEVENRSDR